LLWLEVGMVLMVLKALVVELFLVTDC